AFTAVRQRADHVVVVVLAAAVDQVGQRRLELKRDEAMTRKERRRRHRRGAERQRERNNGDHHREALHLHTANRSKTAANPRLRARAWLSGNAALFLLASTRRLMRWTPGNRGNIEDFRGRTAGGVAGLGIGGFLVLLLLSWVSGTNLFSLLGTDTSSPSGSVGTSGE